jgi:iron complex transport system ATP-binding protein
MISFNGLIKKYHEKTVLANVSLKLPENKLIAFIGSNGAGKSTLISIISRVLPQDEGTVFIEDKEIGLWKNKELAKKISILKQSNFLNVRITVRELVGFGRFPYSGGRLNANDQKIIDEAINYMGLEKFENRYLDELSGGERQMAFIAMTIAQDTKYILLDEPLNNLDMNHSTKIMRTLQKLVEEKNKTVIVVIHDINFVSNYADYIVAMKDGEIISHGTTIDIIEKNVLKEIYDIDIEVVNVEGNYICLYYK